MTTALELIEKADAELPGAERGALLAQAIDLAEAAGEDQLAYAARMRQISNAQQLADDELILASFAICEQQYASDPVRFPAALADLPVAPSRAGGSIHWYWKWIPSILMDSPVFPASDVERALDEFEQSYRRDGLPLKAAAQWRLEWALNRRDRPQIEHWLEVTRSLPRDRYSDCDACALSHELSALLELGQTDAAMTAFNAMIGSELHCSTQPAGAYSHMLGELAEAGRTADLRAGLNDIINPRFRLVDSLPVVGRTMLFLLRIGHPERALTLGRRCIAQLDHNRLRAGGRVLFFAALALVCAAEVAAGRGGFVVPETEDHQLAADLGDGGPFTVEQLVAIADGRARTLAAALDERDGTNAYADRIAEWKELAARPLQVDLKIPVDAEALVTESFSGSADRETIVRRWAEAAERLVEEEQGADAYELATKALRAARDEKLGAELVADCHQTLALLHWRFGNFLTSANHSLAALDVVNDVADQQLRFNLKVRAARALHLLGDPTAAGQLAEQALAEIDDELDGSLQQALAKLVIGLSAAESIEIDAAASHAALTSALDLAAALSDDDRTKFVETARYAGAARPLPEASHELLVAGIAALMNSVGQAEQADRLQATGQFFDQEELDQMALFTQQNHELPRPFDLARWPAILDSMQVGHQVAEDGWVFTGFDGMRITLGKASDKNEIMQIRGQLDRFVPPSARERLAELINEWHLDRHWPKLSLLPLQDGQSLALLADHAIDVRGGISDEFMRNQFGVLVSLFGQFIAHLRDQLPESSEWPSIYADQA